MLSYFIFRDSVVILMENKVFINSLQKEQCYRHICLLVLIKQNTTVHDL